MGSLMGIKPLTPVTRLHLSSYEVATLRTHKITEPCSATDTLNCQHTNHSAAKLTRDEEVQWWIDDGRLNQRTNRSFFLFSLTLLWTATVVSINQHNFTPVKEGGRETRGNRRASERARERQETESEVLWHTGLLGFFLKLDESDLVSTHTRPHTHTL